MHSMPLAASASFAVRVQAVDACRDVRNPFWYDDPVAHVIEAIRGVGMGFMARRRPWIRSSVSGASRGRAHGVGVQFEGDALLAASSMTASMSTS
jgi:hypothetical protein